ncbi:interaptin-like [Mytilus edulis]|uniref:interaptin-like n=1 Tax=Mytilus edulis TaxID=6550 RepID=UPI0039EF7DC1
MSEEECRICGYVNKCNQCAICFIEGCQKCIELHNDSCSTLKKDKIHICSDHDDFVNGYCFICFHLVCKNCSKDRHIDHTFVSIPEAVHNIRRDLLISVNDLEKRKAQEENAMSQFCQRKNDYEQKPLDFINAEENKLHEVITDTKESLVKQIIALNEKNLSAAKEIIPKLMAAKTNLNCVQGERFPIVFLSKWSNPMLVIDMHDGILKGRASADDISMNNNADITRIFRNSLVTHLNPDIQHISEIAMKMPGMVATIDQWKTQGDTVTLPSTDSPEINTFIKNIEIVYNFIIQLKNDLIKSQNDLKRYIDKSAEWTNKETTARGKEQEMHLIVVNQKDKKIQKCEEELKKKDEEIRALKSSKSGKMKSNQHNKSCMDLDSLQQSLHAANMLNEENQRTIMCMENQRNELQDSIEDKDKLIQTLLQQKDELQSRLSSIAGEKLTKGNPGITDLSDPNRPMKISERYGELYDNEWTDAMVNVELLKPHFPDLEKSELDEIIVRHLYRTLMFCYKECKRISLEQTQTIRQTIAKSLSLPIDSSEHTETNLPGWKEISFYRKHHGDDFATSLITTCTSQKVCEDILKDWQYSRKSEMFMEELLKTPFFEKCVNMCWYMAIQEPMMYLDDKLQIDTRYNKTEYKEYVQSGDKVRYIVWPALYLHEKGPLLYKGVVQAYF